MMNLAAYSHFRMAAEAALPGKSTRVPAVDTGKTSQWDGFCAEMTCGLSDGRVARETGGMRNL